MQAALFFDLDLDILLLPSIVGQARFVHLAEYLREEQLGGLHS